jgi:hypothetical protein
MYKNTSEIFCVHVGDWGGGMLWCEPMGSVISPIFVKHVTRMLLRAIENRIYLLRDELFVSG